MSDIFLCLFQHQISRIWWWSYCLLETFDESGTDRTIRSPTELKMKIRYQGCSRCKCTYCWIRVEMMGLKNSQLGAVCKWRLKNETVGFNTHHQYSCSKKSVVVISLFFVDHNFWVHQFATFPGWLSFGISKPYTNGIHNSRSREICRVVHQVRHCRFREN